MIKKNKFIAVNFVPLKIKLNIKKTFIFLMINGDLTVNNEIHYF